MKKKVSRTIVLIVSVCVFISSVNYLVTGNMIPGLSPFGLAILMYAQFTNKENKKWIRGLSLLACVLNLAAAIIQIYKSLIK